VKRHGGAKGLNGPADLALSRQGRTRVAHEPLRQARVIGDVEETHHAAVIRPREPPINRIDAGRADLGPARQPGMAGDALLPPARAGRSRSAGFRHRSGRSGRHGNTRPVAALRFRLRIATFMADGTPEDTALSQTQPAASVAPALRPGSPMSGGTRARTPTSDDILDLVLTSLDDDKAEEIVQIDLRGRSAMADHMVIASGRSSRQVAAISEKLLDRLKETFRLTARVEGKETGDWVLIDTGDVVVHVFRPEVRAFYQLEKMWQATPLGGAAPN